MTLNWIKCSERMPPDDEVLPVIANNIGGNPEETVVSCAWFNFMARSYSHEIEPSWMPYDEETWEMLKRTKQGLKMTTKQRELNLEYWGRVHDMCDAYNHEHGTNIKPQQCVKLDGELWQLNDHLVFDGRKYNLAVAIIEDTPVFVGDKIYHKSMKHSVTIIEGAFYDCLYWTLTPPKPQRTFELNGRQLPCPEKKFVNVSLEILGEDYFFNSLDDRNEVAKAINDLLNNARDKD